MHPPAAEGHQTSPIRTGTSPTRRPAVCALPMWCGVRACWAARSPPCDGPCPRVARPEERRADRAARQHSTGWPASRVCPCVSSDHLRAVESWYSSNAPTGKSPSGSKSRAVRWQLTKGDGGGVNRAKSTFQGDRTTVESKAGGASSFSCSSPHRCWRRASWGRRPRVMARLRLLDLRAWARTWRKDFH